MFQRDSERMSTVSRTLIWKSFDQGRLVLAPAVIGYFELVPGERFRHVHLTEQGMSVTDLGPCTLTMLQTCKEVCEHHQRQIAGYVLI